MQLFCCGCQRCGIAMPVWTSRISRICTGSASLSRRAHSRTSPPACTITLPTFFLAATVLSPASRIPLPPSAPSRLVFRNDVPFPGLVGITSSIYWVLKYSGFSPPLHVICAMIGPLSAGILKWLVWVPSLTSPRRRNRLIDAAHVCVDLIGAQRVLR